MSQQLTKKELLKNADDCLKRANTRSLWGKITSLAFLVFIAACPVTGIWSAFTESGSIAEQALLATSALSAFGAGTTVIVSRVLKKLAEIDKENALSYQRKANDIPEENEESEICSDNNCQEVDADCEENNDMQN